MKFFVLDTRDVWHGAIIKAAKSRGYDAKRIFSGEEVDSDGVGFIRVHADPIALKRNQAIDWPLMSTRLKMIQDADQVMLYEDKSGQFAKWAKWMPPTWRFTDLDSACNFIEGLTQFPLVSKADVGASSVNVRILKSRDEAIQHVRQIFGPGIRVKHCSSGAGKGDSHSVQRDYALLQEFIPHEVTWRVNAIGRHRAIFKRYCYPDRPVAQTGNVEPVMELTPHSEAVLRFANKFFDEANTKWCAIDILQKWDRMHLLETSLAWPWPSPGKCNGAPILGSGKTWLQMFDVMMDEIEAGTF